jgi:hypothetical protein
MSGAGNFIFSKSVLGLVAIGTPACTNASRISLSDAMRIIGTPAFFICPAPEPEGAGEH